MTLEDKRVFILGGTSGIGLAVAEAVSNAGGRVAVVSRQQRHVDAAVVRLGQHAEGHTANLSDEDSVKALFEKVGEIDHLVFTAGDAVWQRPIGETDLADAKEFFGVRYWGAFLAVKHACRLIRPGGSIILTSSTVPRRPSAGFAVGASISSAVEALGRALAVELAPLRVNVVAPGIVRTPLWERLPEAQRLAFFETRGAALPVGRVAEPADIAEAYLFLMRATFATGQTVIMDGGMLLV